MNEISINIYDLNKQAMASVKPMDVIRANKQIADMCHQIWNYNDSYVGGRGYHMLLCRERNDYTVFRIENKYAEFYEAVAECLHNRGLILEITLKEDANYEIWIRDKETDENVVYYLFDCEEAVIEV